MTKALTRRTCSIPILAKKQDRTCPKCHEPVRPSIDFISQVRPASASALEDSPRWPWMHTHCALNHVRAINDNLPDDEDEAA